MAYSAFQNRIKISDVEYSSKGIQLMKNLYWNPVDDPHLLVCGGTGGGKTVLLRTLIRAMAKVGVGGYFVILNKLTLLLCLSRSF